MTRSEFIETITDKEHANMVSSLCKDGLDIINSLTRSKAHLWHMSSALAYEAGELGDAFKKHIVYEKELDMENVIEELGDLEFYMRAIRDSLGITREETLQHNLDKLGKRYSKGSYSNKSAQERADKNES